MFDLPKSVEICGKEIPIRYDFRAILDVLCVVNDPEFTEEEKTFTALSIFYRDLDEIEDFEEAINQLLRFISCGENDAGNGNESQLVNWEKDAPRIIPAVNRILGYETRAVEYNEETNTGGVHWFTFVGAYMEIGDCLFSQVVRIRDKIKRGKKLDKEEREWYKKNKSIIDINPKFTAKEDEFLKKLFERSEVTE